MSQTDRYKAIRKLAHALLYLNGREGHEELRTKYLSVRGSRYDFRSTGHTGGACCDRYRKEVKQ